MRYSPASSRSVENATRRNDFFDPEGKAGTAGKDRTESLSYIGVERVDAMHAVNYRIYVILRFGISMRKLLEHSADTIRRETKYVTGFDVNRINFHVTGVKVEKSRQT